MTFEQEMAIVAEENWNATIEAMEEDAMWEAFWEAKAEETDWLNWDCEDSTIW